IVRRGDAVPPQRPRQHRRAPAPARERESTMNAFVKPGPWTRGADVDPGLLLRVQERSANPLLAIVDVSVSFDGFKALTDLTMVLDDGELRCVIGPNGAGKTTLMDVITGKTLPDRGCVFFLDEKRDLIRSVEHESAQRVVGLKYQRPPVFFNHTARENLGLALKCDRGLVHSLFGRQRARERARIGEILETIGLQDCEQVEAGTLSHGQKQWLEIGMLLAQDPKVLLVDEPVAGMTHQEVERTAELLRSLAGRDTVVVVEHDMDFVRSIAQDTVTVLHEGKILAEGSLDAVKSDPRVIEVYLGE